ncbi:uncharacterized protein LOC143859108 [Tasmannia lanceolata]|uniref:uncharacterized protein LOC143859108 n=1 Tax=Tasmannia lanceolata TaxID=3420 RepID=UPI00406419EC
MKDSPWVIWFDRKYIRGRSFWSLPMPAAPSWAARSIFKARDFASKHICYIVGSQAPLKFWTDPWHPKGALISQSSIGSIINFIPLKATIDEAKSQGWWDMIQDHPQLFDLKQFINSGLFYEFVLTYPIWKPESDGIFRLKSAWNSIRTLNPKPPRTSSIWFAGHTPKFSITSWQAMQDKVCTRDKLHFLSPNHDHSCLLYNSAPESTNHLFFNYSYSAWIWCWILRCISVRKKQKKSLSDEES